MRNSQVINLNVDGLLAFDGDSVIYDETQLPVSQLYTDPIPVMITLFELSGGTYSVATPCVLTYQSVVDHWTVAVSDLVDHGANFIDRYKYVGLVEAIGAVAMRIFKIDEFCVDNESFEDTWMRLPYQVEISGGSSYIRWYAKDDPTFAGSPLWEAPAYQGGTGTTYASSAANVTHRGAVVAVV